MTIERGQPGSVHAAGRYVGATGALVAAPYVPYYCANGVHVGPGLVNVLLTEPISPNNMAIAITLENGDQLFGYQIIDSTHIQVHTDDTAGVPTDNDFSIVVIRTG